MPRDSLSDKESEQFLFKIVKMVVRTVSYFDVMNEWYAEREAKLAIVLTNLCMFLSADVLSIAGYFLCLTLEIALCSEVIFHLRSSLLLQTLASMTKNETNPIEYLINQFCTFFNYKYIMETVTYTQLYLHYHTTI